MSILAIDPLSCSLIEFNLISREGFPHLWLGISGVLPNWPFFWLSENGPHIKRLFSLKVHIIVRTSQFPPTKSGSLWEELLVLWVNKTPKSQNIGEMDQIWPFWNPWPRLERRAELNEGQKSFKWHFPFLFTHKTGYFVYLFVGFGTAWLSKRLR